jgi:hypothetical protein
MAAATCADIQARLIVLHGTNMARVGMDVSSAGANLSLQQPMMEACAYVGLLTASPLNVVDSDVSSLTGQQMMRFFNCCRWRLLDLILTRWPEAMMATQRDLNIDPDVKIDGVPERLWILKQAEAMLRKEYATIEKQVLDPVVNAGAPTAGRIAAGRTGASGIRGLRWGWGRGWGGYGGWGGWY